MRNLPAVILCLFIACQPVNCQRVDRPLQPWMQGVIAVSAFLVLALIAFVVNRLWCQDKDDSKEEINKVSFMGEKTKESAIANGTEGRYSATEADFRCEEGPHVYENNIELECETVVECHVENHVEVLTTDM